MTTAFPSASSPSVGDAGDEDARLVSAIRAGARDAEAQLYRRHAPLVLRLATRLLRSTEEARDVLQDTFLIAFEELRDLKDARAVRSWMQTICVRLVHRRFRRRKLLSVLGFDVFVEDAKLEQLAGSDLSPDKLADLRRVDLLLDKLSSEKKNRVDASPYRRPHS